MGLLQDFRFAMRMLVKHPGFSLVAMITIGLGIGLNSTVFTLTNAVLLKGLPFENPEEILHISATDLVHSRPRIPMSYPDFLDMREQLHSFKGLAAVRPASFDISDEAGDADRVAGAELSANLFSLLGQRPVLGRDFSLSDDRRDAAPVALIGYALWQTRYGGQPGVIGKSLRINQKPYTIVGIMPQGMKFPNSEDLWVPLVPGPDEKRDTRSLTVLGRLNPGVSERSAMTEVSAVAQRLSQTYADTNKNIGSRVMTTAEFYNGGQIRTVFLVMQGAVGFVLLIACANVANLLLSRAVRRTRETSIRTALGANRWQLVRQLLTESVMLSFAGGAIGLALSTVGVRLFAAAVENTGKPYWIDFTMDYRVVLFFVLVCGGAGILFGLAPALQVSRANINDTLREGGRGATGGRRSKRLSDVLLIGEIALTLVLLVSAGLMIRSFLNTQSFNVGIKSQDLLVARVAARGTKYPAPQNIVSFEERLGERVRQIPGIESLTAASSAPTSTAPQRPLRLEDRDLVDSNNQYPGIDTVAVAPGYFDAIGAPLLHGREFTAADGSAGHEIAVVNEMFAQKYWPGEDAVGKRIRLGNDSQAPWIPIVGVTRNILQTAGTRQGSGDMFQPTVYIPFRQDPTAGFVLLARTHAGKEKISAAMRAALKEIDPDLPLFNIATLDEMIAQQTWPYRVFGSLFAIFALIALVMSSVGIYALTAYGVEQQTPEMGLRFALGARQSTVLWLVMRQGLLRICIGLSIGLLAAIAMSRVLATLLFQVTTTDPLTFVSISLILTISTLLACLIPARRAMRMDPVVALRTE